ncbi:MAG: hypothetical protein JWM34_3731 [Ilumatobacteraceae bacterium]|nr:hypothetical protein [Ilumatobacteraceae bacterium]
MTRSDEFGVGVDLGAIASDDTRIRLNMVSSLGPDTNGSDNTNLLAATNSPRPQTAPGPPRQPDRARASWNFDCSSLPASTVRAEVSRYVPA